MWPDTLESKSQSSEPRPWTPQASPCVYGRDSPESRLSTGGDSPPLRASTSWWLTVALSLFCDVTLAFSLRPSQRFCAPSYLYARITTKSPQWHSVSSFVWVLLFYPAPQLPNLLPKILLLPSVSEAPHFGFIPRLWLNPSLVSDLPHLLSPDPFLTEVALLTLWLLLLHLRLRGASPRVTLQLGALSGIPGLCWQPFIPCTRRSFSLFSPLLSPLLFVHSNDSVGQYKSYGS